MQVEQIGDILGKNSLLDTSKNITTPRGDRWHFDMGFYKKVLKQIVEPASNNVSYVCESFFQGHGMPIDRIGFIFDTIGDGSFDMCRTICIEDDTFFIRLKYQNRNMLFGMCYTSQDMVVGLTLPRTFDDPSEVTGRVWTSGHVLLDHKHILMTAIHIHFYEKYSSTKITTLPSGEMMTADGRAIRNASDFDINILTYEKK